MEFVQKPYIQGETIAAISTPPGEGGIAIIRIVGFQAIDVANRIFTGQVSTYKTHTAHFGHVLDAEGQKIDEALLLVMLGSRSFAGEDTVEIQCHGGMIASKKVLQAALEAGAEPATPGAFTFKAFMNGKLDLAQAEAVGALIGAKNEEALAQAKNQLDGALSEKIGHYQSRLVEIAAILEAWVDFPEEGLEFASRETLHSDLSQFILEMQHFVATFEEGQKISEGISLCIIGAPNAGKSSLMNALLRKERAIVTSIAGTTRDLLEEDLTLGGLSFRLIDTAGLRETDEVIEKEGIRRSKQAQKGADLTLLVLDASAPPQLLETIDEKTVVIWNKMDLPEARPVSLPHPHTVQLSAKNGEGIEKLKEVIDQIIWEKGAPPKDEVLLTNVRHKEALVTSIAACERVAEGLEGEVSPEFLAADMRQALHALGTIIGKNMTEEILSSIFSRFCIGK